MTFTDLKMLNGLKERVIGKFFLRNNESRFFSQSMAC